MTDSQAKAGAIATLVAWTSAVALMCVVLVSGCSVTYRHTEAGEEQSIWEFPPKCPGECK